MIGNKFTASRKYPYILAKLLFFLHDFSQNLKCKVIRLSVNAIGWRKT